MSLFALQGIVASVIFAALVFACAAGMTALLIRHLRILDVPNERSSHSAPTPRGGGLAIVGGCLLGVILMLLGDDSAPPAMPQLAALLGALLLVAAISFYDDFKARGLSLKFAVQLSAIGIVMAAGIVIDAGRISPWLTPLLYVLTLLWILGLTNAYNFMDGLDGMAGGTAVIVSGFFSLIAYQQGNPWIHLIALAIAAASLGFLLFNWSPAKIFMGDVGSTFLGFAFAGLAIVGARVDGGHIALLVMPLLLLHYLFDTVFTFCRRLRAGENVFQAHRSHLYQLLNRLGYSHRAVSSLYAGLACLQGLGALALANLAEAQGPWLFVPYLLVYGTGASWIVRRARREGLL